MKSYTYIFLLSIITFLFPLSVEAQLKERAKEVLDGIIIDKALLDTTVTDSLPAINKRLQDSIKMQEMMLQIQEMKLNEILLRTELDEATSGITKDSIRKAEQRRRIDSLRTVTHGIPVIVDADTLFLLYTKKGALTPHQRAETIEKTILAIGKDYSFGMDTIYVEESEIFSDIMYGDKVIMSVTDNDALWQNTSRQELAKQYIPPISNKITELKKEHSILQVAKRIGLFLLVLIIQYLLWKGTNYLFRKLRRRIVWLTANKLKPVSIKDYEFLDTRKQGRVLLFFSKVLQYAVILIQLAITIPILFSIFPQTESLAMQLFTYIFNPVKMIFWKVINYFPNIFIIIVIYLCIRYLVKMVQYIAGEIESEKLKITGFYPDWAQPTYNIVRFLLYVFMIAMIYPYLPGADSGAFQGISIFVGLIVSLGSSSAIANIIAGLVITYMRPFRIGDRIKLGDTEGHVVEKTPFVTRIKTPKNEIITIPNSSIMSSNTVNYSESAKAYGLIIHTPVTYGYDVPWEKAHEVLIAAAKDTHGVMKHPAPFVLETKLDDFYVIYQINAYIKNADKLAQLYSDLHQQIQIKSNEAGLELVSPQYIEQRKAREKIMPDKYLNKDEDSDRKD
ncbi:mechanosensitive ion channel family protein [Dysgonomonas sp. Marseille-P4361]|uniref:mechanosensitive ion channel family protein n=1 Tax=Dysgonomonas sp. Marseille-P4361 TaxID=2161820 RepID=UPI000D553B89|nr:mechanosensitive ion channel family protein [Dysgonomonas sp. Marseille-P4361]